MMFTNIDSVEYVAIAFFIALAVSFIAYKLRMLALSGMIAAAIVGGIIFAFGGIIASVLLLTFFLSGSLLSKLNKNSPLLSKEGGRGVVEPGDGDNRPLTPALKRRGDVRNWKQVLCNGAIPAIAVIIIALRHDLREEISLLFLGALATATADTWATEIGTRFGKGVYNIFTFRLSVKGISGGVSLIGLGASILGALLIAVLSLIRFSVYDPICELIFVKVIPVITISGFCGALLDSIIGATLQAKYKLPDGSIAEVKSEGAVLHSGISFIGNNATNLIATLWGGVIAI
ncbi:MAG: DUF92 domain-containing protein, partial [Ignavibacteriota bacterium]